MHNGCETPSAHFDASFLSSPHYIYEVFRVIDGVPLFVEDHLERLKQTCELSEHCPGFSLGDIHEQVKLLLKYNSLQTGNVKIALFSKEGKQQLLVYITGHQYPTREQFLEGVPVALFRGIRHNPNAKIMDVKLRNATNVMKEEKEVYETLLVDTEGCITEGSRSNVFFIRDGRLITPPVKDVLPGITRKHIIEVCCDLGLEVAEESVPARSVVIMEAAFISGTSRKVLPVNKIDELDFPSDHPMTRKIQEAFNKRVQDYITARKN